MVTRIAQPTNKQTLYHLDNGVIVSVIKDGYGSYVGLYEIAAYKDQESGFLTKKIWEDATDDVIGWQSIRDIENRIRIAEKYNPNRIEISVKIFS